MMWLMNEYSQKLANKGRKSVCEKITGMRSFLYVASQLITSQHTFPFTQLISGQLRKEKKLQTMLNNVKIKYNDQQAFQFLFLSKVKIYKNTKKQNI